MARRMLDSVTERLAAQNGRLGDRLREAFVSAIEDGALPPRQPLPPEREMAVDLGVSRSTLRQCLRDLAEMGLVQTRHGAGTLVTGRIPKALSHLSGFSEEIRQRGLVPRSKVIDLSVGPVETATAFRTGMPLGSEVLRLERLRLAGDEALSYEVATVPIECVGADFDGLGSLYERMDARGCRPVRILQSLEALTAPNDIARLLDIPDTAAVLKVSQVGYGPAGNAVEDATSWYRGDRYKYVGEIQG